MDKDTKDQHARSDSLPVSVGQPADLDPSPSPHTANVQALSLVASQTDNAVIICDAQGRIEWVNRAFTRITEYAYEEVIGQKPGELLQGPDTDPKTVNEIGQKVRAGQSVSTEILNYAKSGRAYWLQVDIQPIHDKQTGQLTRFIAIESDITQRKQTETALRESEQRARQILDTALDAVVTMDERGLITGWNQEATGLFGWSEDQAIGRLLSDLIIPERLREAHQRGLEHYMSTGEGPALRQRLEVPGLHRDGHEFPCELGIAAMKYGQRTAFSGFIRDIRDRKAQEQALVEAKDAAESANRAKSEFLANMSHEIRTPLHGILSFAGFGLKKIGNLEPGKIEKYFHKIDTSGRRLLLLVNDLLDLAKLEAGQMQFEFEPVDLAQLVDAVNDEFSSLLSEKNLAVRFNRPTQPIESVVDQTRIMQVIRNLTNNAIKFSKDAGIVEVSLERQGESVVLAVRDHGDGIPESEINAIFDKFIQSSKTKSGAGGTGLGLSICSEVIAGHGGEIAASNHPEGGAVFHVRLPLAAPSKAQWQGAVHPGLDSQEPQTGDAALNVELPQADEDISQGASPSPIKG